MDRASASAIARGDSTESPRPIREPVAAATSTGTEPESGTEPSPAVRFATKAPTVESGGCGSCAATPSDRKRAGLATGRRGGTVDAQTRRRRRAALVGIREERSFQPRRLLWASAGHGRSCASTSSIRKARTSRPRRIRGHRRYPLRWCSWSGRVRRCRSRRRAADGRASRIRPRPVRLRLRPYYSKAPSPSTRASPAAS